MRKQLIKLLGGYPSIDSAIQAIKNMEDVDKKAEILSLAVQKLYKTISPNELLKENPDGGWMFQGKPITQAEVTNLKEEASYIRGSKLFYILKQDLKYQIGKKIWEEVGHKDDILWGKLITFMWDVVNTRIKKM